MTKKVLFINAGYLIGGDTAMLLIGLPYLDQQRFELYSATPGRGNVYEFLKSIPNNRIIEMDMGNTEDKTMPIPNAPTRALQIANATLKIVQLIRRHQIDLIYVGDRTSAMPIAYVASLLTNTPMVVNAQISHYLSTSALHRAVIRRARHLTVSSKNMFNYFAPYVQSTDKLTIIHNAIRTARFDPTIDGSGIRTEFGIPADAPVVLLTGRLSIYKGQADLIRAATLVLKERSDAYFLMAGAETEAGYQQQLQQMIDELGVGHRVKLMGYRRDTPQICAASTIVTMPSLEEAFGLVALEGMAMEKPVIATRAGGVPEFVRDGEVGILINPGDYQALARELLRLMNNPEEARAMGKRARNYVVNNYDEAQYGPKIANVLYAAANKQPVPATQGAN